MTNAPDEFESARDDLLGAIDAELARLGEPPREPRLWRWLWRIAFVIVIVALLIVSTTEKSEPCALRESGSECR